jgi:hypothetical protein
MATSEDVIRFQELSNKDRILLTMADHTRYLQGSVMAMELVDKIRGLEQESLELCGLNAYRDDPLSRSTTLLTALRSYHDILAADLLALRESKGLL